MTPHDLLAAFETLAEAPDGIAQLRELVLQLAVRGKLVPQDPNDEPAYLLLERIAAEKARLVKEGHIKQQKLLPLAGEDEMPFAMPEGWRWCYLGDAALVLMGNSPPGDTYNTRGDGVPLINGPVEFSPGPFGRTLRTKFTTQPSQMCVAGDLLVCVRGATTGRTNIAAFDTCIGRGVALVRAWEAQEFIGLVMWKEGQRLLESGKGTTFPSIAQDDLLRLLVPLPPLPEQHRIVAKVDALMALLDRLETARSERETTRTALRDAALAALRDAPDAEAVEAAWTRIAERMDGLFTDPADVAPLRQTILQLAVRGKLVPQDPSDEPAGLLLERIAVEKERLIKEGKISKPKPLLPVDEDEMPFKVPEGWAWCRLDALLVAGPTNGWSPKAVDFETPTRTLRLSATTRGTFDGSYFKYVDTVLAEDSPLWLRHSDLLIQRSNTPEYVGIAAVYDEEDGKFIYPDLMMRCRVTPTASVRFVHLSLISPIGRSWFHGKASGTSKSMVKVSQTVVSSTPIPLPPIAEQHRIVAKIDALMALCDALEARLAAAREAQAAFAAAAVHHLDV